MLAVVEPDDDAWLRRVFRFYSRTFSTPLHEVERLPLEDVLRAFYEEVFDQMDEEAREERIEWLLMTPEERAEDHDADKTLGERDDKFFSNLNAEVASGEMIKRPKEQKREVIATDAEPSSPGMQALAKKLARTKARTAKLAGVQLPGPKLKPVPETPPDTLGGLPEIKMSFGDGSNLKGGAWDDLDPLAPPRKKKT